MLNPEDLEEAIDAVVHLTKLNVASLFRTDVSEAVCGVVFGDSDDSALIELISHADE